jgi:hypothetical protein
MEAPERVMEEDVSRLLGHNDIRVTVKSYAACRMLDASANILNILREITFPAHYTSSSSALKTT